jgi:hypothetical protein
VHRECVRIWGTPQVDNCARSAAQRELRTARVTASRKIPLTWKGIIRTKSAKWRGNLLWKSSSVGQSLSLYMGRRLLTSAHVSTFCSKPLPHSTNSPHPPAHERTTGHSAPALRWKTARLQPTPPTSNVVCTVPTVVGGAIAPSRALGGTVSHTVKLSDFNTLPESSVSSQTDA